MKFKTTAGNVARMLGLPEYDCHQVAQVVELELVDDPSPGIERTFATPATRVESLSEARAIVRGSQTFRHLLPSTMRIAVPVAQHSLVENALRNGRRPGAILTEPGRPAPAPVVSPPPPRPAVKRAEVREAGSTWPPGPATFVNGRRVR